MSVRMETYGAGRCACPTRPCSRATNVRIRRAAAAIRLLAIGCMALASSAQGFDAQKGQDGWLILSGPGGNVEDYLHSNRLPGQQLDSWSKKLASVEAGLQQRGTSFLWIVPPNTPTIYPEGMPKRYKQVEAQSRLEQLNEAFAAKGTNSFVDLAPALRAAKTATDISLYAKTDTHWTDVGAFAAYEEVMRRMEKLRPDLKRQLTPIRMDAFTLTVTKDFSGGLATRLGLGGVLTEDLPILVAKSPAEAAIGINLVRALGTGKDFSRAPTKGVTIDVVREGVVAVVNSARCPGLSLAMVHDSFGIHLAPWLVSHFCTTMFYFPTKNEAMASFDRAWLIENKPTFVVLESVERFLVHPFVQTTLERLDVADGPTPAKR